MSFFGNPNPKSADLIPDADIFFIIANDFLVVL